MSKDDAIVLKLTLKVLPDDASLDAGHHIDLVDPLDAIHARHVKRDDHTLLLGVENE